MGMSQFEDHINSLVGDAYWWLICIEKHFDVMGTPKSEKLQETMKTLEHDAFIWWQWWSQHHRQAIWRTFHVGLLWHFKLEYRYLLLIFEEEEDPELKTELIATYTFNLQQEEKIV